MQKFPYKQGPPLSKESQKHYSEIQKYLRSIYHVPTFSLKDLKNNHKKAKILEMVPLKEGRMQEKTEGEQKRKIA